MGRIELRSYGMKRIRIPLSDQQRAAIIGNDAEAYKQRHQILVRKGVVPPEEGSINENTYQTLLQRILSLLQNVRI